VVTGNPHRTSRGELSLRATSLPTILSPCLHDFPESYPTQDRDFLERHVELLSTPHAADTLRCRSAIIQYVRDFLLKRSYLEVQTPILAAEAGGATARPFNTTATEFQDRKLSLRIAPELWLKRLILGGLDRVFEIGPSFRNEGLDKNHNPEFTTCEFYEAFASLDDLILMTEELLSGLLQHIQLLQKSSLPSITPPPTPFTAPFPRLEFIPTIERLLETQLPDLTTPSATDGLITLFHSTNLPLPPGPTPTLTLPRLLDKLSTHLLEPLCIAPTFITHHPSILSPLSKSFVCPTTHQLISARAELYVQNQELANMYEEENSPFEQREKFLVQLGYREDGETDRLDEGYLRALEWGLPPTGGWGCGIDRLVMVMAGAKRIGSVLSFGNLRAVTRGVD
jgi:lysyl-tRNA synthetase, class II